MKSEVCSNQDNLLLVVIFLYFYDLIIICSVTVILYKLFSCKLPFFFPLLRTIPFLMKPCLAANGEKVVISF